MREESAAGYWYGHHLPGGVRVLTAMRNYRAAESAMRKRTRESMHMGETDLVALRLLLAANRTGEPLSPKDLASGLSISSASTTVLLDRLERSGHLTRSPHPSDRRGIVIQTTDATEHDVRETLGSMHTRMIEVADSLSPAETEVVVAFLAAMRRAVEEDE